MNQPTESLSSIPVMILCGGLGTRLREETELRPKPMVEIGGRPILWHLMKLYAAHGLNDFILCLGYKGHVIKDYFLNYKAYTADLTLELGAPERIQYHRTNGEEHWRVTLAETGRTAQTGARVARAAAYVRNDIFCLTYGDGLANIDIGALIRFHRAHGRIGTVTGVRPPGRFGELRVGPNDEVIEFNEKPQASGGLINGGFFVFDRSFADRYLTAQDGLVLEQEPLQRLARDGELGVYVHEGFWQPMDTYRELKLLDQSWESGAAPWKVWSDNLGAIV
jgi:glucose-1-phosphate cytidylyltransferase